MRNKLESVYDILQNREGNSSCKAKVSSVASVTVILWLCNHSLARSTS